MEGLTRAALDVPTYQWKITCGITSTRDYYNVAIWERVALAPEDVQWKRLAVGGFWEWETNGRHRQTFSRTLRGLLH